MNQRAVRTQLEPRRQELLTLLASLGDESTGEHATMKQCRERRKLKNAQAMVSSSLPFRVS